MHRRDFMKSGAALAALMGLPGVSHAVGTPNRKMIFVFCSGGWDPTRTLAPMFGTGVAMEPTAVAATIGGLPVVDHVERPSVRAFFERYGADATIFNGVLVPSIAHEACTRLMMTGSTDEGRSDWGAIVGSTSSELLLPHLVVDGPSFGGPLGANVVRTGANGQLRDLVTGSVVRLSDGGLIGMADLASDAVDRVLAERVAARHSASRTPLETERTAAYIDAHGRLEPLRYVQDDVNLASSFTLSSQIDVVLDALEAGVSRSGMVAHNVSYDSHTNNDATQSVNQEDLFANLLLLIDGLRYKPGSAGGTLLDETTVVVMSEMGRTPQLNGDDGKDHWPFTSAMVIGAGFQGGRVIGEYTDAFEGMGVNPGSGEVDANSTDLSAGVLGATLLASMDIDPGDFLPGTEPITGVLT